MSGNLLVVRPNGLTALIPNAYEEIKTAVGWAFEFLPIDPMIGAYLPDDMTGHECNVVVSMYAGRPVFGTCVITAAEPDDEGRTLPPPERAVASITMFARRWHDVCTTAEALGQEVLTRGNADNLPPPQVIMWEDFSTADDVLRAFEQADDTHTEDDE